MTQSDVERALRVGASIICPDSKSRVAFLLWSHGDVYRAGLTNNPAPSNASWLTKDLRAVPPDDGRLKAGWGNQYLQEMLLLLMCGEVGASAFFRFLAEGMGGEIQAYAAQMLPLVRDLRLKVIDLLDPALIGYDQEDLREAVASGDAGNRKRMDELVERLLALGETPETGCDWRPAETIEEDYYAL